MRRYYLLHTLLSFAVFVNIGCQRTEMQYRPPTAANLAHPEEDTNRESKSLQDKKTEWKTVISSDNIVFSSISFADEKHGIATGVAEYYFLTSDGGRTWSEHTVRGYKFGTLRGEDNLVRSAMSRSGGVFAIGHIENAGSEIFSARSPFTTWKIDTYLDHSLNDISMIDDHVWIVGNNESGGFILQTKGGQRWKRIWKSKEITLSGVSFLNKTTGWCAGGDGVIIHTKDGGQSWHTQTSPTKENLLSIAFVDSKNGYAVGVNGTIVHTTNGGETWDEQVSGTTNYLARVVVVDANEAWVIGDKATVLSTRDGGQHWIMQDVPVDSLNSAIYEIALKGKEVWLASQNSILRSLKADEHD